EHALRVGVEVRPGPAVGELVRTQTNPWRCSVLPKLAQRTVPAAKEPQDPGTARVAVMVHDETELPPEDPPVDLGPTLGHPSPARSEGTNDVAHQPQLAEALERVLPIGAELRPSGSPAGQHRVGPGVDAGVQLSVQGGLRKCGPD